MKVLFLKDVPKLGKRHDIKEVSDGYARNFLIPRKLVEPANEKTEKRIGELKKAEIEIKKMDAAILHRNLKALSDVVITMKGKASEKGSLFASIHKDEVVKELKLQAGVDMPGEYIEMEKPIKDTGEHEIAVEVDGKKGSFKLVVEAE